MTTPEYVNYCVEITDKILEFDYFKEKKSKQKKKIIRKEKCDDKNDFEIILKEDIPIINTIKERYN